MRIRGEESVAELCRREGLAPNLYYRWSKEFLEAGKKRLRGEHDAGGDGAGGEGVARGESILEHPCTDVPCIDPIFGPTMPTGYWSRTGDATRELDAWFVNFYDGPASNLIKREPLFVRAVR